jgi:hypothetical protein
MNYTGTYHSCPETTSSTIILVQRNASLIYGRDYYLTITHTFLCTQTLTLAVVVAYLTRLSRATFSPLNADRVTRKRERLIEEPWDSTILLFQCTPPSVICIHLRKTTSLHLMLQ